MKALHVFVLVLLSTLALDLGGLALLDLHPFGAPNLAGRFAICFAASWAVPRWVGARQAVLPVVAGGLAAMLLSVFSVVLTRRTPAELGGPAFPVEVLLVSVTAAVAGRLAVGRLRASPGR